MSQECGANCESDGRVRILPPKPNQPKINFPKRVFGAQRKGLYINHACNKRNNIKKHSLLYRIPAAGSIFA